LSIGALPQPASMLNLIEPAGLLRHFLAHPPVDFEAWQSEHGMPIFATRFDLLTTADDALRSRLTALPLYRHWGRWLRPKTCFVGSTVSEYALLPSQLQSSQLVAGLLHAYGRRHALLIVKDLPLSSPLLDQAANDYANEFAHASQLAGGVVVAGQALAYARIDFTSIDEYIRRLSPSRRKDLRRKLRSRQDLDVEALPTGSAAFDDAALVAEMYQLYCNVFQQSTVHFDLLTQAFFVAVLRDAGMQGVVFTYRHQGRLIGYNLCFVQDKKLIDKYVGFRYPDARDCNLYFVSWFHNLEYALAHRLDYYVAGWTDPEIKRYLGAQFTWTRHVVYARSRVLRSVLRRFRSHFESDQQWHQGLR
jgi:hypothetical protein